MSKRKLQFTQGGYYHVMNRTPSGIELFKDKEDYNYFLKLIENYAEDCEIKIITKCLMPTHYHILIRQQGETSVAQFIHRLSIAYCWYYRKRYKHHGSIFGGRFKAIEIVDSNQMRTVCCYIHTNAWKAGLVDNPQEWEAGDLALFSSSYFWENNLDPFLSEAFTSKDHFNAFFKAYMQIHKPTIKQTITLPITLTKTNTGET